MPHRGLPALRFRHAWYTYLIGMARASPAFGEAEAARRAQAIVSGCPGLFSSPPMAEVAVDPPVGDAAGMQPAATCSIVAAAPVSHGSPLPAHLSSVLVQRDPILILPGLKAREEYFVGLVQLSIEGRAAALTNRALRVSRGPRRE